jgi:polyphosphate kinase
VSEAQPLVLDPPAEPAFDLDDPALYLNRELSLLEFNARVLVEAQDPRNRLLERVKFLAITASNMDEFYAKRAGWLRRLMRSGPRTTTVDGLTISAQRDLVQERCRGLRREMDECWRDTLCPALAEGGIHFRRYDQLDPASRERLGRYFEQAIFPVLTPLVVDPAHPFPFISSASLSLALTVRHPETGQERFARIKVPQNRPRFVEAADREFVFLEDLIAAHFNMLFPGMEIGAWHTLRVIRSAEIGSPGEEASDLLELIESGLRRRRLNEAVYFAHSAGIPARYLDLMLDELEIEEDEVYESDGPLGLADLMQIGGLPIPELTDAPFVPAVPSVFANIADGAGLFAAIRQEDLLVHHPYESFDATVVRFIQGAADDPHVLAIKQTLYRTSPDSPILDSLIDASGRGKQVAVLVELTARFDEANNIEWARKLEEAGVHVAYGNPEEKIHSKICLVVREEAGGVRLYAHVGTGNYNSRTARVYTDFGLFTADPEITSDLLRVFNHLTGFSERVESTQLLVAPDTLRSGLESRVRREIDHARAGRPARLVFKINALEDPAFTRLLYEAGLAGVQVDLVVRGICRLRPGVPGLSENVRVISVLGRFLEHSRIYRFENGGDPEYFIGSADLMLRNLDGRVEVVSPVREANDRRHLDFVLETLLADARQGWRLQDRAWTRDQSAPGPGSHETLLAAAPFS